MKKRPASASLLEISSSDDDRDIPSHVSGHAAPMRASGVTLAAADDAVALAEKRLKLGGLKVYSPKKPDQPICKAIRNTDESVEVEMVDLVELSRASRRRIQDLSGDLEERDSAAEQEYDIVSGPGDPALPEHEPFPVADDSPGRDQGSDEESSLSDVRGEVRPSFRSGEVPPHGVLESAARYFTMGQVICSFCETAGHLRSDCPHGATLARCFLCGKPGHKSQSCPDDGCPFCGNRGARGHKNCPQASSATWARFRPAYVRRKYALRKVTPPRQTPLVCYVCGENGHVDCSLNKADGGKPSCCNCGSAGHTWASCANKGPECFESYVREHLAKGSGHGLHDRGITIAGFPSPISEVSRRFKEDMCSAVASRGDLSAEVRANGNPASLADGQLERNHDIKHLRKTVSGFASIPGNREPWRSF